MTLKLILLKIISTLLRVLAVGWGNKYCPVCKKKVLFFIPYIYKLQETKLLQELEYVSNDLHNYMCPNCHSHDRERHFILYSQVFELEKHIFNKNVLHFAPERNIPLFIKENKPNKYIKADLFPPDAGVEKIDMQNIPYDNQTFDIIIANHVIEHVENDAIALSELNRILKHGGYAILQTPYSNKLTKTLRDSGIDNDFLRTTFNGQNDHLRLFGKDIFSYYESFGFKYIGFPHLEHFSVKDAKFYGVNVIEPYMIFQKNI